MAVWFWRIIPVGFATVLLSALLLPLIAFPAISKPIDGNLADFVFGIGFILLIGLLVMVVSSPVRLALVVMAGFFSGVPGAIAAPCGLVVAGVRVGMVWPILTATVAAGLRWASFRPVSLESGEQLE